MGQVGHVDQVGHVHSSSTGSPHMNTRVRITHHRENQNIHMEEEEDQVVEVVRDASLLLAHALFVCLFLCKRARKEG